MLFIRSGEEEGRGEGEGVEVMEEVREGGIDILLDHIDETRTKFNHYVELKILS